MVFCLDLYQGIVYFAFFRCGKWGESLVVFSLLAVFFTFFLNIHGLQAQMIESFVLQYQPSAQPEDVRSCEADYLTRLKTPGVLNIAVALGYSDTIDEGFNLVTDQWVLKTVVTQLTKGCQYSGQGFCEFIKQYSEPHEVQLYSRELLTSDQRKLLVNLYIMNSSYDMSHEDNLTTYQEEQRLKSERVQSFYGWALQQADVVFYEGHSRDGGGPDFSPPRSNKNETVDYPWYRKNQPGLKFLLAQLNQVTTKPMVFGLFSCASQQHFQKKLSKYFNKSNTIMSTRVVEAHYTKEALLFSLESLLNFECSDQLSQRLKDTSFIINRGF